MNTRPIAPFGRLLRTCLAVAAVLAAASASACFRSDTVIHVKADGTGTIEQTNLANKQMLGMAAGMAKSAAQEAGADASKTPSLDNIGDLFDDKVDAVWEPMEQMRQEQAAFEEARG